MGPRGSRSSFRPARAIEHRLARREAARTISHQRLRRTSSVPAHRTCARARTCARRNQLFSEVLHLASFGELDAKRISPSRRHAPSCVELARAVTTNLISRSEAAGKPPNTALSLAIVHTSLSRLSLLLSLPMTLCSSCVAPLSHTPGAVFFYRRSPPPFLPPSHLLHIISPLEHRTLEHNNQYRHQG